MKTFKLVREVSWAMSNVMSFNSAMMASAFKKEYTPMAEILPATQSWYAYEFETDDEPPLGGFSFAPSKYVGYQGMTSDDYLAHNGVNGRLNGRDTEKVLRPLSTLLMPGDSRYAAAHAALAEFCALFGKAPNARARISMLDLVRDEQMEKEAAQVRALTLLISTLSEEGRSQLKYAAFP